MLSFKQFIVENKSGANLHMTHIEDAVLYGGVDGTRQAINALRELRDMLAGHSRTSRNVTVKYDGAPAVFCGFVPKGMENEGKFFVAKKGLFNKSPKYYTSHAEIDADTSGDLATKLKACLDNLPSVFKPSSKDIFQGDLMFTADDIQRETIDGNTYLTFHPNTIVYAVPLNSEAGNEVARARMGIVFHTRYRGDSLDSMRSSFDVSASKDFQTSPTVWLQDANLTDQSGTATLTQSETVEITKTISNIGKIFRQVSGNVLRYIENNDEFAKLIEQFNNTKVRENVEITNTAKHTKDFMAWLQNKYQKEMDKRKTEKGKDSVRQKLDDVMAFFTPENQRNMKLIFDLQNAIVVSKKILIKKLNDLNKTKTFLRTKNGFKVTNQEGYVAIDTLSNGALKLVDRLEFSYSNFSPDIVKGWEK